MGDALLLLYNKLPYLEVGFSQQKTLVKSLISSHVQPIKRI